MTTVSVSVLSPLETSVWWRRLIGCGELLVVSSSPAFPDLEEDE